MNILAHLYLSGKDPEIMTGNFLGDFIKGNPENLFPENIVKGIKLHREIDTYTDSHDIVRRSKKRLNPRYRHYKGVLIDIYYDHYLAKNWHKFSDQPLLEYISQSFETIRNYKSVLTEEANQFFYYMQKGKWLQNYQYLSGIESILKGMSKRTKFKSYLNQGIDDLQANYEEFEEDFNEFFPLIVSDLIFVAKKDH